MANQASTGTPDLPPRPAVSPLARNGRISTGAQNSQPSVVRHRLSNRQSNASTSPYRNNHASSSPHPDLLRRRSSILSFSSFEDATASFTDDIISPTTKRKVRTAVEEHEITHWSSTPLAFAILPAIAGLLFNNGSAFVTDVLLLGLAAVFLNWSIRIPRDWYHSAQQLRRVVEPDLHATNGRISDIDEAISEEAAVESTSEDISPITLKATSDGPQQDEGDERDQEAAQSREAAVAELRSQEHLALLATFLFPVMAAYLLHVIRGQLSRPSTGLVSDYNLTIFLLAAEFWPCRQVARLITRRTLTLQRTVTGLDEPYSLESSDDSMSATAALASRVAELEGRLSTHSVIPNGGAANMAQKADVSGLESDMRKRYEPRLDGLERAVRRYEKRSTTLAMLMEQRLQSLETRLQDTLSLAAVAAQHSRDQQTKRGGVIHMVLSSISTAIVLPMKLAWGICVLPLLMIEKLLKNMKDRLLGFASAKGRGKSSTRSTAYTGFGSEDRERTKDREKTTTGKRNVR